MYEVGSKMSILEVNDVQQQILVERLHLIMEIERAYNIIHLLFVFWIPTFIIVISYCAILCILNSFASSDNRRESYIDRSPHKVGE